jgi:hypothetical protein
MPMLAYPHPSEPVAAIFAEAEAHRVGSVFLHVTSQFLGDHRPAFSIILLQALCTELYLKCVIAAEGGKVPHKHDLKRLFDRTSPESQASIRRHTQPWLDVDADYATARTEIGRPIASVDFDWVIGATALAFEHFRYLWEPGAIDSPKGSPEWAGNALARGIRARILEMRPDLEQYSLGPADPLPGIVERVRRSSQQGSHSPGLHSR